LLIAATLRKATPETLAILSNKDVIASTRTSSACRAVIAQGNGIKVFNKPLATVVVAVALYNSNERLREVSTTAAQIGLRSSTAYSLKDCGRATDRDRGDDQRDRPAHGNCASTGQDGPQLDNLAPPPLRVCPSPKRVRRRRHRLLPAQHHAHQHAEQLRPGALHRRPDHRHRSGRLDGHADQRDTKNRIDHNGSFATAMRR